jgi:hypothetical protein
MRASRSGRLAQARHPLTDQIVFVFNLDWILPKAWELAPVASICDLNRKPHFTLHISITRLGMVIQRFSQAMHIGSSEMECCPLEAELNGKLPENASTPKT